MGDTAIDLNTGRAVLYNCFSQIVSLKRAAREGPRQ